MLQHSQLSELLLRFLIDMSWSQQSTMQLSHFSITSIPYTLSKWANVCIIHYKMITIQNINAHQHVACTVDTGCTDCRLIWCPCGPQQGSKQETHLSDRSNKGSSWQGMNECEH